MEWHSGSAMIAAVVKDVVPELRRHGAQMAFGARHVHQLALMGGIVEYAVYVTIMMMTMPKTWYSATGASSGYTQRVTAWMRLRTTRTTNPCPGSKCTNVPIVPMQRTPTQSQSGVRCPALCPRCNIAACNFLQTYCQSTQKGMVLLRTLDAKRLAPGGLTSACN